jgi:hypothetical protein
VPAPDNTVALLGLAVGIASSLAGVVFQMGRYSARLDSLEQWRAGSHERDNQIFKQLRGIKDALPSQDS